MEDLPQQGNLTFSPVFLIHWSLSLSLVLSNWSQKYPLLPWNKWARVFFLPNPWKAFIINKLQDKLQEDQVELAQRRTLHCYSRHTFFFPLHMQDDVIKSSYLVKPTHYFWFTNPHALISYKMLQILLALFHRLNISLKKKKKKKIQHKKTVTPWVVVWKIQKMLLILLFQRNC